MIVQRQQPHLLRVLGDADAVAEACLRPIQEFALQRNIPMVEATPVCMFHEGGASIHLGFLRYRIAPIGLPTEFAREAWRWPVIAHEIAHELYHSIPGFAEECLRALELDVEPEVAEVAPDSPFLRRVFFANWLIETVADAIGTLMIGPAYVRAMILAFQEPQNPALVLRVRLDGEGAVEMHPPEHLRVRTAVHLLEQIGFGNEGRELRRLWGELHGGEADVLLLGNLSDRKMVPLGPFEETAVAGVDRLLGWKFESLSGTRLLDVPGLSFSTAQHRATATASAQLSEGRTVKTDARVLVAAATTAALDHPEKQRTIMEAMHDSILGIGTGERHRPRRTRSQPTRSISSPRPGTPPPLPPGARQPRRVSSAPIVSRPALRGYHWRWSKLTPDRVVDALLMAELLEPKRRR